MGRKSSPWYWAERNVWLVNIHGVRHVLGEHPADAAKPKKGKQGWNAPQGIADEFHKLMGVKPSPSDRSSGLSDLLQAFHEWNKQNRAARTADRYFDFLDSFERRWHGLTVGSLNAGHVQTWLNEQTKWNNTTKRNAITALQRALNWAMKNMGLDKNPIRGMEKPKAERRTTVLSAEEFKTILKNVTQPFKDLVILSYDTGARPFEIKGLEARHVRLNERRAVLTVEESKGKKAPRVIYFPTERSMGILKRLIKERPTGPLLLNAKGNPWNAYSVKIRFEMLEKKIGKRYHHYAFRHSRITEWLKSGVDSHVAAALSGHKDTKMIDTVYSHVAADSAFMLSQAKKGT